jgi:hypothetical protein
LKPNTLHSEHLSVADFSRTHARLFQFPPTASMRARISELDAAVQRERRSWSTSGEKRHLAAITTTHSLLLQRNPASGMERDGAIRHHPARAFVLSGPSRQLVNAASERSVGQKRRLFSRRYFGCQMSSTLALLVAAN